MKIWLDDIRSAPAGFIHVRNLAELEELLDSNQDAIEVMDFDHDLGEEKTGIKSQKGDKMSRRKRYFVANFNGKKSLKWTLNDSDEHFDEKPLSLAEVLEATKREFPGLPVGRLWLDGWTEIAGEDRIICVKPQSRSS